jgi:hypothetical protein
VQLCHVVGRSAPYCGSGTHTTVQPVLLPSQQQPAVGAALALTLSWWWQGEEGAVCLWLVMWHQPVVIIIPAVQVTNCLLVPGQQALTDLDRGGQHVPQQALTVRGGW